MNIAYLLTGSNIGAREEHLQNALKAIMANCGNIIDRSSLYETAAWGEEEQADFLNQALMIETKLGAGNLLKILLDIETGMGRNRTVKYGARTIDIDLLFFNHAVIRQPGLTVPHPELQNRRFVLEPMNEIAPSLIHPVYYKTIRELLNECPDTLPVKKI